MRYSIRLSYNGSGLNGWQVQPNALSVQELVGNALTALSGDDTGLTGSGRTDTSVNAVNYIAHFDLQGPMPYGISDFIYKLNAILPKNIVIHEIRPQSEDFHSRFSARERQYRYFLHRIKDPFSEAFSYRCKYVLDVDKMNEAAAFLTGRHDFSCFEKKGGGNVTSTCTVYEAVWESYTPHHAALMDFPHSPGDYLVFKIRADRFLRNMVRAIVGTLIDVGRGRISPEKIQELIKSGTRSDAGESVPGKALFLDKVLY